MICKICNKECKDGAALSNHLSRTHKINTLDLKQHYYNNYLKKSELDGLCKTCGKPTKFISLSEGYKKHCNPSCAAKDPLVQEKLKNTCLERFNGTSGFQSKKAIENNLKAKHAKKKIIIDNRPIIHICKICNLEFKSFKSVGKHLMKTHHITTKEYYDKYFRKETEGYCIICGKEAIFDGLKNKYKKYCSAKCANSDPEKVKNIVNKIRQRNNGQWTKISTESMKKGQEKRKKSLIDHFGTDYGKVLNELGREKREQTCLERYGTTNPLASNDIQNKIQNTCLERYGVKSVLMTEENKQKALKNIHSKEADEKRKQTSLKHYGVDHPFQSEEVKNKVKQTNLERYGYEYGLQSNKIREKIKQTCLEKYGTTTGHAFGSEQFIQDMINKYGVENCMQVPEFKEKMQQTYIGNNGGLWGASKSVQEKMKETSLEKYGTERPQQSEKVQNKIKNTNNERYGADNIFASDYGKNKIKETNRKRYGVDNTQSNKQIKQKSVETFKQNLEINNKINNKINLNNL